MAKSLLASAKGGSPPDGRVGASGGEPSTLAANLNSGSKIASKIAEKKIKEIKQKIGLIA